MADDQRSNFYPNFPGVDFTASPDDLTAYLLSGGEEPEQPQATLTAGESELGDLLTRMDKLGQISKIPAHQRTEAEHGMVLRETPSTIVEMIGTLADIPGEAVYHGARGLGASEGVALGASMLTPGLPTGKAARGVRKARKATNFMEVPELENKLLDELGFDKEVYSKLGFEDRAKVMMGLENPAVLPDVVPELKRAGDIPTSMGTRFKKAEADAKGLLGVNKKKAEILDQRYQDFQDAQVRIEGLTQPNSAVEQAIIKAADERRVGDVRVRLNNPSEQAARGVYINRQKDRAPSDIWWSGASSDNILSSNTPVHESVHHLWNYLPADTKKKTMKLLQDPENAGHIRLEGYRERLKNQPGTMANELFAFTAAEILTPGSNISAGPKTVAHVLEAFGSPHLRDEVLKRHVAEYYKNSLGKVEGFVNVAKRGTK